MKEQNIKRDFASVSSFPNVIDTTDCIHIAMRIQSENEFVYLNQIHVHTIHVQAIRDLNMILVLAHHIISLYYAQQCGEKRPQAGVSDQLTTMLSGNLWCPASVVVIATIYQKNQEEIM